MTDTPLASRAFTLDDQSAFARLSGDFHAMATSTSDNPILNLYVSSITHIYADRIPGSTYLPDRRRKVIEDHRDILRAMIRNQPKHAEKLMREHMVQMGTDVRKRYPGVLDEPVNWY